MNLPASHYVHISTNISTFLRNLISFSTSHSLPSNVLILSYILYFFCCPSMGGNLWLLVSGFHILFMCMLVADYFSKYLWVSLVCPIQSTLNLTPNCLQLLWVRSHKGLMWFYLLVMFLNPFCHLEFLAPLMVK